MNKPVIVHIRASNFVGGPEKQILGHVESSYNCKHIIITFEKRSKENELYNICISNNIDAYKISSYSNYSPSVFYNLYKLINAINPDIICTHGYKPSILSFIIGRIKRIPIIMFSRGHTGENLKIKILEKIEQFVLNKATLVVSVSGGYAKHLADSGIKTKNIRIIRNAVDVNSIQVKGIQNDKKRSELNLSNSDYVITTAGRLSPEKSQIDLIKAFKIVVSRYPHAKLLILGDGALQKQLERYVIDNSINGVKFLGFRRDIYEILFVSNLFVLPSLTEGLPNAVLEAFALRLPVVATDVGGVPEVLEDEINGFLVPVSNPDILSEKIIYLIKDRKKGLEMGLNGFQKVLDDFSFKSQSTLLENEYRKLLLQ